MNELVQEIITYLIISGTTLYTLYRTVLFFTASKNKSACLGCAGGSCGINVNRVSKPKLITSAVQKGINSKSIMRVD